MFTGSHILQNISELAVLCYIIHIFADFQTISKKIKSVIVQRKKRKQNKMTFLMRNINIENSVHRYIEVHGQKVVGQTKYRDFYW